MTSLAAAETRLHHTDARARIGQCLALIKAGRCGEARALLSGVAEDEPRLAAARERLALSLQGQGDLDGAEREMRAAIRLDRRDHGLLTGLGAILVARGAWGEAERALRGALALHRFSEPATVALTHLLLAMGRPAEALQVTVLLSLRPDAPPAVLQAQVAALSALGAPEDARIVAERAQRVAARR